MDSTYYFLDAPFLADNDQHFVPYIYTTDHIGAKIPKGFNTIAIHLKSNSSSTLDWKEWEEMAFHYIQKGFKIFWKLDMGLFSRLSCIWEDHFQAVIIAVAIRHFSDTIWPKFQSNTVGVCLYEGPANFLSQMIWEEHEQALYEEWLQDRRPARLSNEKQTRALLAGYSGLTLIDFLARYLPGEAVPYVLLQEGEEQDPIFFGQLIAKDHYECLHRGLAKGRLSQHFLYQDHGGIGCTSVKMTPHQQAICLPTQVDLQQEQHLKELCAFFKENEIAYRIIDESKLTSDWQGIDDLFVCMKNASPASIRMFRGFCAAGGRIVYLDQPSGLPNEISFADWKAGILQVEVNS